MSKRDELIAAMQRFQEVWNQIGELEASLSKAENELVALNSKLASIVIAAGLNRQDGITLCHEGIVLRCTGLSTVSGNNFTLETAITPEKV